jgi:hypothetical protein
MSNGTGRLMTLRTDETHRLNVTRTNHGFMVDVEDDAHWAVLTLDDSQAQTLATWIQALLEEHTHRYNNHVNPTNPEEPGTRNITMTSTPEEAALAGEEHDVLCQEYGTGTAVHDIANGCRCGTIFTTRINELLRAAEALQEKAERYKQISFSSSTYRQKRIRGEA